MRSGLFKGTINAIAQTPDGYLWLGTEFGVYRFDGVQAVLWEPPANQRLSNTYVRALLVGRDGTLWIGTRKGLASWKADTLTHYRELDGYSIDALLEDRQGTIWVGAAAIPKGALCAITSGRAECHGAAGDLGLGVQSIYEDSGGHLWVASSIGLWRWRPGPPERQTLATPDLTHVDAIVEVPNHALLVAVPTGLWQLAGGKSEPYPIPGSDNSPVAPRRMIRDRDGSLWIGTANRGLLHVHGGRSDSFGHADGLSDDTVTALFEDREGSIWVATRDGLDRFNQFPVNTISSREGLSGSAVSVLAARDGSVWLGTGNGLNCWNDGEVTIYRKPRPGIARGPHEIFDNGLPDDVVDHLWEDENGRIWIVTRRGVAFYEQGRFTTVSGFTDTFVHAIAGDAAGNLWIDQGPDLLHLRQGKVVERVPHTVLADNRVSALAVDSRSGGLWIGFGDGRIEYIEGGQSRERQKVSDGFAVTGFQTDADGTLWVATAGGLSQVKSGRVVTLTSKHGLPCDTIHWVMRDAGGELWLGSACGLVRIARKEIDGWAATGDPHRTIACTVFDDADGVRSLAIAPGYSPRVSRAPDGRLWFLSGEGVSVIDPGRPLTNPLPPPVHIERMTADRQRYDVSQAVRLPRLVGDLEIDYTALSLVAPEKNQFRIKLEGKDADWQEVGTRRQAFYNGLPSRNYRFHVIASNNSGVWNETGAVLEFSVAPAFYQALWFQLTMAVAALGLLVALDRFRLRRVASQFNLRLEERVNERTRVARDLHDTLLQSFHAVLLRLRAATLLLRDRPDDARQALDSVIDDASDAIADARDAVQGLRASNDPRTTLVDAIATLVKDLESNDSRPSRPQLIMHVEGTPGILQPLVRDDIYRIAREALRNAFDHANATQIEVDVRYDRRQFRLRIRDNGQGIESGVLQAGRSGHFGLAGMRERAELVKGTLTVWSEPGSGTEVELAIPARVAYAKH